MNQNNRFNIKNTSIILDNIALSTGQALATIKIIAMIASGTLATIRLKRLTKRISL